MQQKEDKLCEIVEIFSVVVTIGIETALVGWYRCGVWSDGCGGGGGDGDSDGDSNGDGDSNDDGDSSDDGDSDGDGDGDSNGGRTDMSCIGVFGFDETTMYRPKPIAISEKTITVVMQQLILTHFVVFFVFNRMLSITVRNVFFVF